MTERAIIIIERVLQEDGSARAHSPRVASAVNGDPYAGLSVNARGYFKRIDRAPKRIKPLNGKRPGLSAWAGICEKCGARARLKTVDAHGTHRRKARGSKTECGGRVRHRLEVLREKYGIPSTERPYVRGTRA